MAQIVIRGIDDDVMRKFKAHAKAQGKSAEQAVRELIEAAAAQVDRKEDWLARATAFREELKAKYGTFPDSAADLIREDRDSR